jgi:hypothetical protein
VPVFLAAIHDVLLSGAEHPLARRYRSVCQRRGLDHAAATDDVLAAELRSFCASNRDALLERCATRATQTNEVGRCVAIRAVLADLAARGERAVGLLDLGCSAGLNLFVDRYAYDYSGRRAGAEDATPLIACDVREGSPRLELPEISRRVGLDLAPLDATKPDEVSWLLACLWPDDLERFARLDAALSVAAARHDEVDVLRGDMIGDLERAAALAHDADRLVVINSWSAVYVPSDRRRELAEAIASLAAHRPCTWLVMEHPVVAHDLGVIDADEIGAHGPTLLATVERDGTSMRGTVVGGMHPHGAWLTWTGLPTTATSLG